MNFPLTAESISAILGTAGPLDKVKVNWPLVEAALDKRLIYSPLCAVAAIATIAVETGTFTPIKERGGPSYITNLYENRKDLGNTQTGDGDRFRGRGFVQITGRANYTHYGTEMGRDLVSNPDLALDPAVAAEVLARYFEERHIPFFANQQNWEIVRRRVNGGLNGWPKFADAVTKLVTALKTPVPITLQPIQEATT